MQKKFTILVILLLFISWGVQSQYKSYFGKEYTKWYIFDIIPDFSMTIILTIPDNEVTQIDGKEYKRAQKMWNDEVYDENYYFREEEESGRLYYIDKDLYLNDGKEFLISDMSLQKGDTVYFPKNMNFGFIESGLEQNVNGYFTLVDSIYIQNARKHIQTNLITRSSYYDGKSLTFIEGLGPNYSIGFYLLSIARWWMNLTCFETESEFWKNEKFWNQEVPEKPENCILNYTGISHSKAPNPFRTITSKTTVEVLFDNELTGIIRLYDINAREMISKEIEKTTSVTLSIESLPKGSYILWVYDKRGDRVWSEKLVVSTR